MTAASETTGDAATADALGTGWRIATFVGTVLVIIALAVLPLLTPWFIHAALDASDASARLGLDAATTHALSDRSVEALVLTGAFDFVGPSGEVFYDADEQGHLVDARRLLWLFLGAGAVSLALIGLRFARVGPAGRVVIGRTIARAGLTTGIVVAVLGLASLVAFGTLFTLFHQVFFPAGNWAFDPTTQRLVQLYPFGFWQIAAGALGALVFVLAIGAWLLGRTLARRHEDAS